MQFSNGYQRQGDTFGHIVHIVTTQDYNETDNKFGRNKICVEYKKLCRAAGEWTYLDNGTASPNIFNEWKTTSCNRIITHPGWFNPPQIGELLWTSNILSKDTAENVCKENS